MICEHWQVAAVPFPFVDSSDTKRRPALAISNRGFNEANGHTLMAMITTAKREAWPSDHALIDFDAAGLHVPCVVRWKVFTLPNEAVVRIIGELADDDREALSVQLRKIVLTGHA